MAIIIPRSDIYVSSNTTGNADIAIGFRTFCVPTGTLNNALGIQALDANTTGNLNTSASSLEQNLLNLFSEKTVILYTLPASTRLAEMKLFTASGMEIQTIPLSSNGNERIEISGNTLEPGMYTYVLVADGKTIDSKQMVLTK